MSHYIKWFNELSIENVDLVGGKNASLGEMYQNLSAGGIRIPNGFAITADAYRTILDTNDAWEKLHAQLDSFDPDDVTQLQERGKRCREIIHNCTLPDDLISQIKSAYEELKVEYGKDVTLAVRSSATAEDSPEASFAGQNDSYLNIGDLDALLDAYKRCLASNFTDRSIHYKYDNGFDYLKVYLSVVVMKMVRSDISTSGVMFSIDTETGFKDTVFINAAYGLGENIVQGTIAPDSFYVHKPTFKKGYRTVLKRRLGDKVLKMVFADVINEDNIAVEYTKNIPTAKEDQTKFCISDEDVTLLAEYAIKIEEHYSKQAGYDKPMDMEWAKDGLDGHIYIVQARPETIESRKKETYLKMYSLKEHSKVLIQGQAVGTKIGSGKICKITDVSRLDQFEAGDVLLAETTSPDWEPVMKIASAIVTNSGGENLSCRYRL